MNRISNQDTAAPIRIKICGITRAEDARLAASAGADAIGLNFYLASPRFVSAAQAAEITAGLPADVHKVGVFVNAELAEIRQTMREAQLDMVQLHGDEPAAMIRELGDVPVIKAIRCRDPQLQDVTKFLAACGTAEGSTPAALLLDAYSPDALGGTGKRLDWTALAQSKARLSGVPLLLAGGLTPGNVAEAIAATSPAGVDVASGVEAAPGVKDPTKVRLFIEHATAAFGSAAS